MHAFSWTKRCSTIHPRSTIHMLILKASDNNKSTLNTQLVPIRIHTDFFSFLSLCMFFGGIVNVGKVCIWIECCLYAKFHNSDSISVKTCNNFQAQFSTNRRTMRTFSRSNSRIFALVWLSLALYHCWSDSMCCTWIFNLVFGLLYLFIGHILDNSSTVYHLFFFYRKQTGTQFLELIKWLLLLNGLLYKMKQFKRKNP